MSEIHVIDHPLTNPDVVLEYDSKELSRAPFSHSSINYVILTFFSISIFPLG